MRRQPAAALRERLRVHIKFLDRFARRVAHQALLLSFLIIIFYSPLALLYDVSLHLSFLATAGIVYLHEGIKKLFYGISQGGYLEIMGTTISAYIATLPYVVFTFGTASLYAVFANFVVVPFVPLGMLLTFMLILISQVSVTLTHVLGYAVTLLTNYIIWVARVVEGLPFSSFPVSLPAQSMIIMYIIIIGVYFIFLHKKKDETRVTKDGEIISGVISY